MESSKTPKLVKQMIISIVIFTFGFLVMVYGITVEDEPTLVALLLVTTGSIWFFITLFRMRSHKNKKTSQIN